MPKNQWAHMVIDTSCNERLFNDVAYLRYRVKGIGLVINKISGFVWISHKELPNIYCGGEALPTPSVTKPRGLPTQTYHVNAQSTVPVAQTPNGNA